MPSYANKSYKKRVIDVKRLVQDYDTLLFLKVKRGKTALDHLTRSGVVLLNGAWESYIEDALFEVAVHLATIDNIQKLPKNVQKTLASYVKNHKEDNKSLSLAGDGWKKVYLDEVVNPLLVAFHSPKISNIDETSKKLIGTDKLSICLDNDDKEFIDKFFSYRGYIAHRVRGKGEEYLSSKELTNFLELFQTFVNKVDNHLLQYVKKYKKTRPWNKAQ